MSIYYLCTIYYKHSTNIYKLYIIIYICTKDTAAKNRNKLSLLCLCQQPQLGLEALALLWNDGHVPGIHEIPELSGGL